VTAREDGGENAIQDLALAHDSAGHLLEQGVLPTRELLQQLDIVVANAQWFRVHDPAFRDSDRELRLRAIGEPTQCDDAAANPIIITTLKPTVLLAKSFAPGDISADLSEPESGPGRELGVGYKYVAMAMQFAGGIVLFLAAGWALDRWLHSTPVFTVAGTLLGAVLGFVSVYRRLQADIEAAKRERHQR